MKDKDDAELTPDDGVATRNSSELGAARMHLYRGEITFLFDGVSSFPLPSSNDEHVEGTVAHVRPVYSSARCYLSVAVKNNLQLSNDAPWPKWWGPWSGQTGTMSVAGPTYRQGLVKLVKAGLVGTWVRMFTTLLTR